MPRANFFARDEGVINERYLRRKVLFQGDIPTSKQSLLCVWQNCFWQSSLTAKDVAFVDVASAVTEILARTSESPKHFVGASKEDEQLNAVCSSLRSLSTVLVSLSNVHSVQISNFLAECNRVRIAFTFAKKNSAKLRKSGSRTAQQTEGTNYEERMKIWQEILPVSLPAYAESPKPFRPVSDDVGDRTTGASSLFTGENGHSDSIFMEYFDETEEDEEEDTANPFNPLPAYPTKSSEEEPGQLSVDLDKQTMDIESDQHYVEIVLDAQPLQMEPEKQAAETQSENQTGETESEKLAEEKEPEKQAVETESAKQAGEEKEPEKQAVETEPEKQAVETEPEKQAVETQSEKPAGEEKEPEKQAVETEPEKQAVETEPEKQAVENQAAETQTDIQITETEPEKQAVEAQSEKPAGEETEPEKQAVETEPEKQAVETEPERQAVETEMDKLLEATEPEKQVFETDKQVMESVTDERAAQVEPPPVAQADDHIISESGLVSPSSDQGLQPIQGRPGTFPGGIESDEEMGLFNVNEFAVLENLPEIEEPGLMSHDDNEASESRTGDDYEDITDEVIGSIPIGLSVDLDEWGCPVVGAASPEADTAVGEDLDDDEWVPQTGKRRSNGEKNISRQHIKRSKPSTEIEHQQLSTDEGALLLVSLGESVAPSPYSSGRECKPFCSSFAFLPRVSGSSRRCMVEHAALLNQFKILFLAPDDEVSVPPLLPPSNLLVDTEQPEEQPEELPPPEEVANGEPPPPLEILDETMAPALMVMPDEPPSSSVAMPTEPTLVEESVVDTLEYSEYQQASSESLPSASLLLPSSSPSSISVLSEDECVLNLKNIIHMSDLSTTDDDPLELESTEVGFSDRSRKLIVFMYKYSGGQTISLNSLVAGLSIEEVSVLFIELLILANSSALDISGNIDDWFIKVKNKNVSSV